MAGWAQYAFSIDGVIIEISGVFLGGPGGSNYICSGVPYWAPYGSWTGPFFAYYGSIGGFVGPASNTYFTSYCVFMWPGIGLDGSVSVGGYGRAIQKCRPWCNVGSNTAAQMFENWLTGMLSGTSSAPGNWNSISSSIHVTCTNFYPPLWVVSGFGNYGNSTFAPVSQVFFDADHNNTEITFSLKDTYLTPTPYTFYEFGYYEGTLGEVFIPLGSPIQMVHRGHGTATQPEEVTYNIPLGTRRFACNVIIAGECFIDSSNTGATELVAYVAWTTYAEVPPPVDLYIAVTSNTIEGYYPGIVTVEGGRYTGETSPWGEWAVERGNTLTITIGANTGYHLADARVETQGAWTSVGTPGSYEFINVQQNHGFHLVYTPNLYEIVSGVSAGDGIIIPTGTFQHAYNTTPTYQMVPGERAWLERTLVDGVNVGADLEYTFAPVRAPHTIMAEFNSPPKYTVTATSEDCYMFPSGAIEVWEGDNLSFSIMSAYGIEYILIDGVAYEGVSSFTFQNITENHTIHAVGKVTDILNPSASFSDWTVSPYSNIILYQGAGNPEISLYFTSNNCMSLLNGQTEYPEGQWNHNASNLWAYISLGRLLPSVNWTNVVALGVSFTYTTRLSPTEFEENPQSMSVSEIPYDMETRLAGKLVLSHGVPFGSGISDINYVGNLWQSDLDRGSDNPVSVDGTVSFQKGDISATDNLAIGMWMDGPTAEVIGQTEYSSAIMVCGIRLAITYKFNQAPPQFVSIVATDGFQTADVTLTKFITYCKNQVAFTITMDYMTDPEVSFEWDILSPNGTHILGSGTNPILANTEAGEYSITFTAVAGGFRVTHSPVKIYKYANMTGGAIYYRNDVFNTPFVASLGAFLTFSVKEIAGTDSHSIYSWSVLDQDGNVLEPTDNYTITGTDTDTIVISPINENIRYYLRVYVYSDLYPDKSNITITSRGYFNARLIVNTKFSLSANTGDTTTIFQTTNETTIYQPELFTLEYEWTLYNDRYQPSSAVSWNPDEHATNPLFTVSQPGRYTVGLHGSATRITPGGTDPVDAWYFQSISVGNITNVVDLSPSSRYKIILANSDAQTTALLARKPESDVFGQSIPQFAGLKFTSILNATGSSEFTIYHAELMSSDQQNSLVSIGAHVCILDNYFPVWYGIITELSQVNNNVYNAPKSVYLYKVKCAEAMYDLGTKYIPKQNAIGTTTGTISDIVRKIIPPDKLGELLEQPNSNYAVNLKTTSVLDALDTVSNQLGWRYRTRPNIKSYYAPAIQTSNGFVVDDASVGDIVFIVVDMMRVTTTYTTDPDNPFSVNRYGWMRFNIPGGDRVPVTHVETNTGYILGYVETATPVEGRTQITLANQYSFFPWVDGVVSAYHMVCFDEYVVDYMPSYYQKYISQQYTVNKDITNVDITSNIIDKYSSVSVYGVGYSSEYISSSIKLWFPIEKDYTIPGSFKVTQSFDCNMDSIKRNRDDGTYAYYTVITDSWAFPLIPWDGVNNSKFVAHVFYTDDVDDVTYLMRYDLKCSSVSRYYDQNNNMKTSFELKVGLAEVDAHDVIMTSVVESLVSGTNIVTGWYGFDDTSKLPAIGGQIWIGDSVGQYSDSIAPGLYKFDPVVSEFTPENGYPVPHGHLVDVLCMPIALYETYTINNPVPGSPMDMYPKTSISIKGPDGYSQMELERLCCRYVQYGSNYADQSKGNVRLQLFTRDDYTLSTRHVPYVGDRIDILSYVGSGMVDNDYELQEFTIDTEKMSVSVKFGMPFVELGDALYNLESLTGMTIIGGVSDQ